MIVTNEMTPKQISRAIIDTLDDTLSLDVPCVTLDEFEQIGERAFKLSFYISEEGSHIFYDESAPQAKKLESLAISNVDVLLRDIEAQFAVDYRSYLQVKGLAKSHTCLVVFLDAQVDSGVTKMEVPCSECSGTGRAEIGDYTNFDILRCTSCDGSGVMDISVLPPKEKETLKMVVLSRKRRSRRAIDLS